MLDKKKQKLIVDKSKQINEILNGMEVGDLFVVLGNVILNVYFNMKNDIIDFDKSIAGWLGRLAKSILSSDMIDTGDQLAS